MPEAFFRPDGPDRFVPTELCRGPWGPDSAHGGPPAALLGRAIDALDGPPDAQVARITFELLRPVPLEPLTVAARVVRPGRRIQLAEARLSTDDGEVVRARAWRLRRATSTDPIPDAARPDPPPPGPDDATPEPFFDVGGYRGYHDAIDARFVAGGFVQPGPATVWLRSRVPLVEGEQLRPLSRVLIAADSGNGVSATLDFERTLFVNTDLSVHLHREPAGEWICLAARTVAEPYGIGLADTALSDVHGRIGRSLQTLFIAPRT